MIKMNLLKKKRKTMIQKIKKKIAQLKKMIAKLMILHLKEQRNLNQRKVKIGHLHLNKLEQQTQQSRFYAPIP